MSLPIEELTPRQIVAELDKYIIGQDAAKRAVAVALRNRYRRQQLPPQEREDVLPKNILMIGPTGVGKTEIARRLAQMARAPFIKVEATKFTEVGYVGRDVESMVRDLVAASVRLVETERYELVRPEAENMALDRLVDLLDEEPGPWTMTRIRPGFGAFEDQVEEEPEFDYEAQEKVREARRAVLRGEIEAGQHDDAMVEIEIEEASNPFLQVFTPQGIEEMGLDGMNLGAMGGTRRRIRRATVKEAKEILLEQEAKKLLDNTSLHREAIHRAEQTGIIFLDEIDKIAGKSGGAGPDVSREGVQRDLLPVIEGGTVPTKFGPVRTDHVLFIAAGAFTISKPSDLIPELQGRLPIRVELESLTMDDFRRILVEPKNALVRQYQLLLRTEGVEISFTDDALDEIANFAAAVNEKTENIGARRLHTVLERLLEDVLFAAPEASEKRISYDRERVKAKLDPFLSNLETSRRVL